MNQQKKAPRIASREGGTLHLLLLGPPIVSSHGHLLTGRNKLSRKLKSLLAYLALQGPAHRSNLMADFWPDVNEARASASLRAAIRRLRLALPRSDGLDPILFQDEGYYRINPTLDCTSDVNAFEEHLGYAERLSGQPAEMHLRQAVQLYRGDFMAGYQGSWIQAWRPRLQMRFLRAAEILARILLERQESGEARRLADRILSTDPAWEGAHQIHIQIYLRQRDRMSAIRQFQQLESSLKQVLGVAPSQASLQLHQQITDGF